MTRLLAIALLLVAAPGCSLDLARLTAGADASTAGDGGVPLQVDGGWTVEGDGGTPIELDASAPGEDASTPDAGPPASTCPFDRNLNVRWSLVSARGVCTADRPVSLTTTARQPCDVGIGTIWDPDGTAANAPCVRDEGTDHCTVELLYTSAFDGAPLFRTPTVGETITMTYEGCVLTWRANNVLEGAAW
jgi:hypothetical protein